MLSRLAITNLTVFEKTELELGPSLNVISGETGAGKTLLSQGVSMICGGDVDPGLIGPHGTEGYVEAEFTAPAPAVLADLADGGDQPFTLARRLRSHRLPRARGRPLVLGPGAA